MNGIKKLSIWTFIALYGVSYLLQNTFFIDRKKVYAADTPSTTNLVAVFVDKNIYQAIKGNANNGLVRYTTKYIQKKIANSKAIVFPIDTTTLKAHDISQILENLYFEGIKDESSKLVGTVLIGDVPLPVVENNGFVYPSIFPYVDFEKQEFIYDNNKKFFVYNNNPNGQAEIRHGIIKFDKASEYSAFFDKVKSYNDNPTSFIDKAIRYEDFIGLKKYFIPENTKYYVNSMIFAEDIGYHRFNNLLLNILKNEHNDSALGIGNDLQNDLKDTTDPDLKAYAQNIASRNNEAASLSQQVTSNMPTLTLQKATQEMLKGYDGLISSQFLSKIKNNVAGLARRYKTTDGETFTDYSSLTDKIVQKDNRVVGDLTNNVQPLLIQINDYLENGLNTKIEQEKYYLTVPVPVSYLDYKGVKKVTLGIPPKLKCVRDRYNYYRNNYFGADVDTLKTAVDTSIFRGTYQNLSSISGQAITNTGQSIGGSYKLFSTQIEANRAYNINNTENEVNLYNTYKTNKQELRGLQCPSRRALLFFSKSLDICLVKRVWKVDESNDQNKCNINNIQEQGGCETMKSFAARMRGGASPLNMNSTTNKVEYAYNAARLPIYDIAGAKKIDAAESEANNGSAGVNKYAALIQEKISGKAMQSNTSIGNLIQNPKLNANDLKFSNQLPVGDVNAPTWVYNPPLTYAQTDFFSIFGTTNSHIAYGGKAVLYTANGGACGGDGKIYTYRTLDSRIKNISPSWDQISSTDFYKFKDPSSLYSFYTSVMTDLAQVKADITDKNNEYSGTDSNDNTGVISNLIQLKNLIASGNNGMQEIIGFSTGQLLNLTTGQLAAKASERNNKNLNTAKAMEISGRIQNINQGLESMTDYVGSLSISNSLDAFDTINQSEGLKNQKVEILDTRKANINQNMDYIIANTNILKNTFTKSRNIYTTIGQLNDNISLIQAKRTNIAAMRTGNGCSINHYKSICDVLSSLINTLQTNLTTINTRLHAIQSFTNGGTDDNGNPIVTQPFVEINQAFSSGVLLQIPEAKNILNTFLTSSDPDKKEVSKGMNLTTADRPIDNIRNITFKGIGGDNVRLNYPNLYEVEIFKKIDNKLILKGTGEIREAIKTYLINKAIEYNTILQQQQIKKSQYYSQFAAQFNLLGSIDSLANPNTHNYNLLPTNYFIDQLVKYLDTLENSPQYGKKSIYGDSDATTSDQKIDMIAKLLYYQNSTRPERIQQSTVAQDMTEIKESFDINQKTSQVARTYLTEGNNQGKFITPVYDNTGYEVGYINSDGDDYISAKPTPAFIQQIQAAQEKSAATNKIGITAADPDNSQENLQAEVDSCEGVDTQGQAALVTLSPLSSPWSKAMKCRGQKILKKPFDIQIGFKNAEGPIFLGTMKELTNSFENAGSGRKEYGAQRSVPNNDDTINQAQGDMQQKLQGYNTYGIVNVDKTIISTNTTGNPQLKIGMAQNMGDVNVKISGTGDDCFKIMKGQTSLSDDICKTPAKAYYNPNTEEYAFDIVDYQHKAGTTALKIELCPSTSNACIVKQQVVNILPGPIENITIDSPATVMEGGEIPFIVRANDKDKNNIGQSLQSYSIMVNSGDGKFSDGTNENTKISFSDFLASDFVYQAPTGLTDDKNITITLTPDQAVLGSDQSVVAPKAIQKTIKVVKGIITLFNNNKMLYQTDIAQKIQQQITYNLPKDETDIQYQDTDGIVQIKPENLANLIVFVKDKKGNTLNTAVNIASKKGLLQPGTIDENTLVKNGSTKKQLSFKQGNDFVISKGRLDLTLYPNFKAGDDTITINIPGTYPIIIPVIVNPGPAKTVLLNVEKNKMDLTVTTGSKGTIDVVDSRNNKVTTGTTIKLGVIGPATTDVSEFIYSGNQFAYTVTTKEPGGEGYIFAYIKDRALEDQSPGYERFIVQESILPKEKLNVMYLNLFGTDRGNQRGYFSENDKVINTITNQSNKLLATTTEIVDPSKIKQIEYIINPNAQIQSLSNKESTLAIEDKQFVIQMSEMGKVYLGTTSKFRIQKLADSGAADTFGKKTNALLYIPEPTDSVITGNETTAGKIIINGREVLNLTKGTMDPTLSITADNETIADMETYTMTLDGKNIGKLMLWSDDDITANSANISLQDPTTYGMTKIFSEGSTNTQGIGIYVNASAFAKQGYDSIEDSADPLLGIGFTSNFKNIANFANGKSVGESTLPYGSQFLINFGDPLLGRRDKNPNIPTTDFDASIGQTIYADPTRTIFKVFPIDFNKDGLKDLIVVYTDGVVKLLKNYGGTQSYKDMQELMIIAQPIKEVYIGDVDGNGYDDIIIITTEKKGIVYLNDKGVFPVDGKNICLNVNADPGTINPAPDDFSNINQMFLEDMDKDGKIDIVTNDNFGDIKIFYGGSNTNGINYISSVTGTCDNQRYARQKNNYKIIKRYGIKVNDSRYIQDASLIHRKGITQPVEGIDEEKDIEAPDTGASGVELSKADQKTAKTNAMNQFKTMVANNDTYIAAGNKQLAYTDNPLSTAPVYESLTPQEITYLPIDESNDAANIYKEYVDVNGGILRQDDDVVIKTTILSKKDNNKLTYIDQLRGSRIIAKDPTTNKINSFAFTTDNTGGIQIDRNGPEGYQFVMDNIQLNSGEKLSFSYTVKYQQQTPAVTIDVKDQDLLSANKFKDTYPDITINSTDSCQKDRWIYFNNNIGDKKSYGQVYDEIQKSINNINSGAQATQAATINGVMDQLTNVESLDNVSALPGMDSSLESRSAKNILSSLLSPGGASLNINTSFIDDATNKVSKKMDTALQGLCQGFNIGNANGKSCQGVPVPFNQAFLAPGDYHIFGCVPKIPNPLYAAFKTINDTLGKGMPLLNFPGNRGPTPVGYIPAPGVFGFPFKGASDGFFLGMKGGTYPSLFRLYVSPTLTLGLGIAMCFGPYTVGKALPKPFRDMGGNCIVFAVPPLTTCDNASSPAQTETYDPSLVSAANQGTCNNPPKIGNTIVFADDNNTSTKEVNTASSPLQMTAADSPENTCESCSTNYSPTIPQGNFGGLVSIDQEPITITSVAGDTNAYDGYQLDKGPKITLKKLGAKTKGLVECVVQSWMTRQIQYIQNNLTKMTIQLDLPEVSSIFQGFDKIGNLQETYQAINQQDQAGGYIQSTSGHGVNIQSSGGINIGNGNGRTQYMSKQELNNLSQKIGKNPFEAIQQMFKEVPLINIDSKDINIKIPALTSDDINTYGNYLNIWIEKNSKILEDRTAMLNQVLALCGTTDKLEAQKEIDELKAELPKIDTLKAAFPDIDDKKMKAAINSEISDMQKIINLPGDTTRQKMGSDVQNIGINIANTTKKVTTLPRRKILQTYTSLQVSKLTALGKDTKEWQPSLDLANAKVKSLEKCSGIAGSMDKFLSFKENSAGLISSVKENIAVLNKYKQFPTQLYQWTHITDRYMSEISALLSNFVGGITNFLTINATRFSSYVDAITLLIGSIKTWQAIIDFSVNRSQKCSKCSNDNYGSFSCSLSFLCPKLPIFPIPAFKIPNIYMDMSHIDLGMNIILPKINFTPIKIPLPQLPDLPEPPVTEIDLDVLYGLDVNLFKDMSLPTIPVIPEPPTLPEPPSFIPSIKMDLPVLPPAPKIPKIAPEINVILNVAKFIGKVFCIVKGGIGLVGEKGVKGKIEQLTQRTRNVPVFDYFDVTTKFKDPPLQGFDYKLDAYTTLKFNFDGVYDVFNTIAQTTNNIVSKTVEAPVQEFIKTVTDKANNNFIVTGMNNTIQTLDQSIKINYHTPKEETGMIEYTTAYADLKKGLLDFKNATIDDKQMNDRVKKILATVENKSTILPATSQIQQVEKAAQGIINTKIKENQALEKEIKEYDKFIKRLKGNPIVLVSDKITAASLTTPILTIDSATNTIIGSQEDPTKTYLNLNKNMVKGYLDAVNNDGPEKLNMTQTVYDNSKKYLETTKEKIDTALLAYESKPVIADTKPLLAQAQTQTQTQTTCTNCSTNGAQENNYSADISAYVKGVFVEGYSGSKKNMINTVSSADQVQNTQAYSVKNDLNNDKLPDILMYDSNTIYIKYAKQDSEHLSPGSNSLATYYSKFYSYENEHPRNRYISSVDQINNNTDAYGYMTINDITIKIIDKNSEPKNFKTDGQSFDTLQLSWQNSATLGEKVDGYLIKVSNKIDDRDTPNSFWETLLGLGDKPKYIVVLPKGTEYKKLLLTIDQNFEKRPVNIELGDTVLAVEYFDPAQEKISVSLKNLPRKRLYTNLSALTIHQEDLSYGLQKSFTLYKKTSPRSNQTVAGMQNLGDINAPVGNIVLWRDTTNEAVSTGVAHQGYINTHYTLKSFWTDDVVVNKMIIQQDGKTILEKNNTSQTGTIDLTGLFFTGIAQQSFDFIAIDQNNNIAKETVTLNIQIPDIQVIDLKKSGEKTANIVAKISNDLDEGMIIFQRLRNGARSNIKGTAGNKYGGFDLSPKQTIITGGIFTIGNDIGLYDNQGNEIATVDSKTNEIAISKGFENKVAIHVNFNSHIPVIELRDTVKNITLFQIVLPVESITNIQMNEGKPNYEELQLANEKFGEFNNGYCIKNSQNDCILYTNNAGAIYIPGIYANSLVGEYIFDKTTKNTKFIIKDQSNKAIATLTLKLKAK